MHRVFSILFSWALAAIAWADVTADPRLKEILDLPDEQEFTGRFCKFLLEVPAPGFSEFRNGLQQGMEEKSLSRRHAWRALGLADMRWVELDLPGYVAACKAGGMQIPGDGKFHAVMRALETDPEAAMRWFVELGLDKNMGDAAAVFMAQLAEKDPQRAVGFFMGLKEHPRFGVGAAAILRSWAKQDADAAWAGLKTWPQRAAEPGVYPPNPGETDNLRAVVCGEVARKDPARAERLFESIESLPERARARKRFLRNLGSTHLELALEFARKWNTPAVWEDFTLAASYGTAGETLRRLLEVLPKEHVERCLVKFFTTDEDPLLPVFQHAGLVSIFPDKALRHAMILAMLGTEDRHRRPLPVALTNVVFDNGLELLAGDIPDNVRLRILAVMVGRDYQVVLPWLRQLREAQWKPFVDDVARSWPDERLADDTRRLLVGESPLELELGKKLAERWWDKDPVGAFPQVIGKHGAQLVYDIDFEQFLRGCGGDVRRMQAMLSSIPDEPARRVALERLKLWSLGSEPAAAVLAEVLEGLKQPGNLRDTDRACGLVAYHENPGMDALIAGIPDERVADRDRLLAMRASYLMGKGAQDRALPLWRQVRDDRVWMVSFERFTSTGDPRRIRNWESLIEMVTVRPASKERTAAIKSFSEMIARHAQKQGLEIAGKTTCDELRACLLTELAERIQDPKLYETGIGLVNRLPENEVNSMVRSAWRVATVRIDPAAAWAQAVGLGLETEEGGRIGRMAMERLAQDDAKAALALLIQTGKSALRTEFFRPVALALVSRDPAAAFKSARMMPPDVSREILSSAVSAWAKTAPEEACRASWGIEQAGLRDACLQGALRIWLDADVDAALAWIKALDDPGFRQAGMNAAMKFLAQKHPVKAAALCLEFRPEHELAGIAGVIATALAESDYEEACCFLTKAAVGADVQKMRVSWQGILVRWFERDPASAASFLVSLEPSPVIDSLNAGLDDSLLPRYAGPLAGWKSKPPAIQGAAENGMNDLREIARDSPEKVLPFVKSLAAAHPDSLPTVARQLEFPWSTHPQHRAAMIGVLALLPENERLRIASGMLRSKRAGMIEWADAVIEPLAENSPIAVSLAAVSNALLERDLAKALRAAVELPIADFDPLVCRILAAFRSCEEAAAGVRAIESPARRARAEAWLNASGG